MTENKYITLAIHTYDSAVALKDRLEENDIPVELQNVDIECPGTSCGVRVRIPAACLPKALRIVEDETLMARTERKIEGGRDTVLIPVDFSEHSFTACKVAFAIAKAMSLRPVIMHVYATPYFDGSLSYSDSFTVELRDTEARKRLQDAAGLEMQRFCKRLDIAMLAREIANVKYTRTIHEGVPEDVIVSYTRQTPPAFVMMATRDSGKKARELIGSIAAEVLDNCRVPVFVVPENFEFKSIGQFSNVMFFCNVEQRDLLSMDMLVSLLPSARLKVCLLPVTDKGLDRVANKLRTMASYFSENYPGHEFSFSVPDGDFQQYMAEMVSDRHIDMIVVPNKKRNIFARLFNPGIGHKILFDYNIPMLSLPV